MNKMNEVDIAWLAGMMEGETAVGCWLSNQNRGGVSSTRKYARISISSVDRDVLERLLELTGVGSIVLHYGSKKKKKESHQQSWTWAVGTAEDVLEVLSAVNSYGFFSKHRQEQIDEAFKAATETSERKRSGESYRRKRKKEKGEEGEEN